MALILKNKMEPSYSKLLTSTLGKTSETYSLDHICIEDNIILSTNGKALTVVESKHKLPVKSGLYLLKSHQLFTPSTRNQFPNWRSILQEHVNFFVVETKTGEWINALQWNLGKNDIPFSIQDNIKLIKALKDVSWEWDLWYGESNRPVVFKADTDLAKVTVMSMPFSVGN